MKKRREEERAARGAGGRGKGKEERLMMWREAGCTKSFYLSSCLPSKLCLVRRGERIERTSLGADAFLGDDIINASCLLGTIVEVSDNTMCT